MKNKFMTKALAVVLSASMALSLSSATALTANGAAAPKLTKKAVTVKIGKKAKNKLTKASFKAGWRITKASVKKTAVAKAKTKKNKKVVVVTGVTAGSTKAVLKLKNAKTAATKKLTFKVKVKKAETPIEEPVAEVASFVSAKQTKNNEVEITLDKELEAVPTADVLRIYESDKDYAPTAINFGADKKTLVVNFDFAASDSAKSFTYTFKTTDGSIKGEASITTKSYDVAKIVVENQTVPAGKLSTLKFGLESAAGIDVTTAGDNLSYTTVSFEGDEARAITSSTNPQVLLSEVGDKTKMTITYTKDTTIDPVTVEITAVEAEATKATAMNFGGNARRAWLTSSPLESASVFVDEEGTINFWSKTDDAASILGYSAVAYDEIEVTSSKEEIVSVTDTRQTKKYDEIKYTGLKTGRADIVIKCVEHIGSKDIPTTYTIPVEVKAKNNDLATFEVSKGSVSITNAYDDDYSESVDVYALNSNGTSVDASYSVEVTDSKGNATKAIVATTPASSVWKASKEKTTMTITAQGAAKGTYSVKITCEGTKAGGTDSETKSRTISVRVEDVLSVVTGDSATPTKEIISDAALFLKDGDVKDGTNVSMAVKINGKFVGYVRNTEKTANKDAYNYVPNFTVGSYKMDYLGLKEGATGYNATTALVKETLAVKAGIMAPVPLTATTIDPSQAGIYPTLVFYVQDKSQSFVHESTNAAVTTKGVSDTTVFLGGDKVKAADFATASGNQVKVASNNKNLFALSIFDKGVTNKDVYFFGATSSKNEGIAAAGSYTVVAYDGELYAGAATKDPEAVDPTRTQVGNKKSVNVSYAITAPEITYSPSESADMFANPSTWLVLEDNADTLHFAWKASKDDKDDYADKHAKAKANKGAAFTTKGWLRNAGNNFTAGNKVFATCVPLDLKQWGSYEINYVSENEKSIGA